MNVTRRRRRVLRRRARTSPMKDNRVPSVQTLRFFNALPSRRLSTLFLFLVEKLQYDKSTRI